MDENDQDYCERRAREERQCAETADCEEARHAHLRLAEAYERRARPAIGEPDMPMPVQPSPASS